MSGLFTTGALALAYNPQVSEYKLVTSLHTPVQNAVAAIALQENTGTAVVRLDGFTLDVNFKYNTIEDDYGVPGSDFINAEILDLAVDQAYDSSGNEISDFTDFNDHLIINAMLVAHMLQNKMLERTTSIPKEEVMPFGKYKATALTQLKISYVVWVLELKTLNKNLRKSLESLPGIPEFKRRQADAIMFSKPCFQRDDYYSKNQRIAYNNAKYNKGV